MASIHWRRKSRKVYVYYQHPKTRKLTQLSRKETKHLDGQPPEVAHAWVRQWEKEEFGIIRNVVARKTIKEKDRLALLWKGYQTFKATASDEGRRPQTIHKESEIFYNYIVPFFVYEKEQKRPELWHPLVPGFHTYLGDKGLSVRTRQKILWTLKRFGEHLVFANEMSFPYAIRPPKSKVAKNTPLKLEKTPDEIISFARFAAYPKTKPRKTAYDPSGTRGDIDFNLAIFLGYFASLGPGELFALEKSDFLTGAFAEEHCKTLKGFREHKEEKLGSTLAVVVNKTLPLAGDPQPLMKNDYRYGVVNIWHPEAAKIIAKLLKNKPEGRLFPFSYGHLIRRWREQVSARFKLTPHDLRRASGLYLGRKARIKLTLLQEHMRHAEIETTLLYCREPSAKEKKIKAIQNLDDVA